MSSWPQTAQEDPSESSVKDSDNKDLAFSHRIGDIQNQTEEIPIKEKILCKNSDDKGHSIYKVKWKDCPLSESSYVSLKHLTDVMDLVEDFEKNLRKKYSKYLSTPKKITFTRHIKDKLYVNISWNKSPLALKENKRIPDTLFTYDDLRSEFPLALLDYFESRMKIGGRRLLIKENGSCSFN